MVMVTGGLHEDGLSDTADGLGGGSNKDRRLEIMKDSRVGAFGVIALVLIIGLKWAGLAALYRARSPRTVCRAVISAGVLPLFMRYLPLAKDDGLSADAGAAWLLVRWSLTRDHTRGSSSLASDFVDHRRGHCRGVGHRRDELLGRQNSEGRQEMSSGARSNNSAK